MTRSQLTTPVDAHARTSGEVKCAKVRYAATAVPAIVMTNVAGATHAGRRLMRTAANAAALATPGAVHTFVGCPRVTSQIAAVSTLAAASTCVAIGDDGSDRAVAISCHVLPCNTSGG